MTEAALTWIRTGDTVEVAEIEGGRLALHASAHGVDLCYQADRPAGQDENGLTAARASQRPANRRYWELAAISPGWGMAGGHFKSAALAKDLLDRALSYEPGLNGGRLLESAGYQVTSTDAYGGVRWVRRTGRRNDVIVTNAHRVYAVVEPRDLAKPEVVLDLSLDNRVVERGIGVKPVSVHYVWPRFIADTDTHTLMAIHALNRAL